MQITEHLRERLQTLDGAADVQLPTEAELVQRFRVSRQTVRRAYSQLVAEGYVERSPGRGSFPSRSHRFQMSVGSVDDQQARTKDRQIHVLRPITLVRNLSAATQLGLPSDEVSFLVYQHLHEERPVALSRIYMPPHVATALSEFAFLHEVGGRGSGPVISLVDRKLKPPVAMAKQLITAVRASADVTVAIDCELHQPLLKVEFLFFDADARPVEWSLNYYNPESSQYRAQLRRHPNSPEGVWTGVFGSYMTDTFVP